MASQEVFIALETLHRELERLEPAIQHVETAQQVTQMVKAIPDKCLDLVQELKILDTEYKEELKQVFVSELSGLTEESKKLQNSTKDIQQQVILEQEALSHLKGAVQSFHDRIEKISFPERLDKLDANVAGIMAAIQSVQSRLDALDRNASDRLRDIQDHQREFRTSLQSGLSQLKADVQNLFDRGAKKQQTNVYITWGLLLVGIILSFVIKG